MKKRAMGEVLLDLEKLLDEMYISHDLQLGDVLGLIMLNTQVHYPESIEEYEDGGHPELFYGKKKYEQS